jgi:hypothetical protein
MADIDARKIRKVARLLGMKPKEVLDELKTGNTKLQQIVDAEEDLDFSKKVDIFAKKIGRKNFKGLIEFFLQDAPLAKREVELVIVGIISFIIAVFLLTDILAIFREPFFITTTIVLVVLAILLLIIIFVIVWKLFDTILGLTKAKKSPERYAIEEIANLIKHIDEKFPD